MTRILTFFVTFVILLSPAAFASAQTVGDANKLMHEADAASKLCPPKKDTKPGEFPDMSNFNCAAPLNMIAMKAGMLGVNTLNAFADRCKARMVKDLKDSACGEQFLKRPESVPLEPSEAAGYKALSTLFVETKRKK